MRLFTISLLLSITCVARAQWPIYTSQREKDSMLTQLANTQEDTVKVKIYLSLFYDYVAGKKEMRRYADHILSISQQSNYKKGIAEGYNCIGLVNLNRWHLSEALEYFGLARYMFESIDDKHGLGGALCNSGIVYGRWNNIEQALDALLQAKKLLESINDKRYLSITVYNLGSCYYVKKDYDKAIAYYTASKALFKEHNIPRGEAMACWAIGRCYKQQKKYTDAEASAKISLELAQRAGCDKCVRSATKLLKHVQSK